MDELLAEWTLVRRPGLVQELFKDLLKKIGSSNIKLIHEQFSDDSGRIDLIYETNDSKILLVELELGIDAGKYNFVLNQTKRYMSMGKWFPGKKIFSVIFYAQDITQDKWKQQLQTDCKKNSIHLVEYDLEDIQKAYEEELIFLSRNSGLLVEKKGIRSVGGYSIATINRILLAYRITGNKIMDTKQIANAIPTPKGSNKGQGWATNTVSSYMPLPEGFGLVKRVKRNVNGQSRARELFEITELGEIFMNKSGIQDAQITRSALISRASKFDLTIEQIRISLQQLLKDDFKELSRVKAQFLFFFRVLSIDPSLIPPQRDDMTVEEFELCQKIMGTKFSSKTNMGNVLTWTRNWSKELGLVDVIKLKNKKTRCMMTSLGSRVYGALELTQSLKREMIHIPQQATKPM